MAKVNQIESILKVADGTRKNKVVMCLVGPHGRGKTSIIKAYAKKTKRKCIVLCFDRLTPEDSVGLPIKTVQPDGTEITKFATPEFVYQAVKEGIILFCDEINYCPPECKSILLEMFSEYACNSQDFHPRTLIVCAMNPDSIAEGSFEFSKAVRDRMCLIPIEDSFKEYEKYYEEKDLDCIKSIFSDMPELLTDYYTECEEYCNKNAEPTPRSIEKIGAIFQYCSKHKIEQDIFEEIVKGYVGSKYAVSVCGYIKNHDDEKFKNLEDVKTYEDLEIALKDLNFNDMTLEEVKHLANEVKKYCPEEIYERFFSNLTDELQRMIVSEEIENL